MQVKPPPSSQPLLFTKTLLCNSCFPLLTGLLCDSILHLTLLSDEHSEQNMQGNLFFEVIRQGKDISYGTYSSFVRFMITMLIIHLISETIQRLKFDHDFLQENNDKKQSNLSTSKSKKTNTTLLSFFVYAFAYFAIFNLYSLLGTQLQKGASSLETFEQFHLEDNGYLPQDLESSSSRMLEDISNDNQSPKAIIKAENRKNLTTFPLGRVLGLLNIEGSSVVFSKDETVLFVGRKIFFGVTAVDITNWENPRVITTYRALGFNQVEGLNYISLLLSPDGKQLFASNMAYFAHFYLDDSNASGNNRISTVDGFVKYANISTQTSLALSPDSTKLFVSGCGFQVFDLSKPLDEKVVKDELPAKEFNLSSVGVSVDGKSLFLINGTRLDVMNITDINNMKIVSSFESENTPGSFIQSKDGKVLTLIGFKRGTRKVVIEKIDVSDATAPVSIKTFSLDIESFSSVLGLNQSPKETYLYFKVANEVSQSKLLVFDTVTEKLLEEAQNIISRADSIRFSSDEKNLILMFEEYIATFQLYRSFPNERFFTIAKNTLAQIPRVPKGSSQFLKEFSSTLLSVDEMSDSAAGSRFTFTDISNKSSPVEINSFTASSDVKSVSITKDEKMLFASFKTKLMVYDISGLKSAVTILASYALDDSHEVLDAVFTSDGKTCYALIADVKKRDNYYRKFEVKAFDFSDLASIKEIGSYDDLDFWRCSPSVFLLLSKDEKQLFVGEKFLIVFNLSARKLYGTYVGGRLEFEPSSISLSPDGKILVIRKEDPISSSLIIVDMRNQSARVSTSSIALPKSKTVKNIPAVFSPNSQQVYVEGIHDGKPGLLVFDISDPSSPKFQNPINFDGFTGFVDNFVLSEDGLTAYLASDSSNEIYVANIEASRTLFLGTESFRLGEKSLTDVMILGQKSPGDFAPLNTKHKLVKASLFSTKIMLSESSTESTFAPFPYWMTFLKDSGSFVVEPKKQRDLGTYTFYSVFSMQLNLTSFEKIQKSNTSSEALVATLISLGYLDSDLYVTGNLGAIDRFFLTSPYVDYKAEIYKILKENYFEMYTVFDVVPSLDLVTSKEKLQIQTPSDNSLKVEILFTPPWQAMKYQFLSKRYGPLVPLITDNKLKLSMEGSTDDINSALKKLVMNTNFEGADCSGTITIWDHLNPSINQTLKNLSSYFEVNKAPMVNTKKRFDVQGQIDAKFIYTGEYFVVDFLNETFLDKYSENLQFSLASDNKERSPAPNWLIFSDSGLKGTAPEEFLNRKVNLILTVKNEFRSIEVPITLNIRLSAAFILKLFVRYSPYILTALGLWVFANRIYNVLGKNKYRHEKEFYITVGQEITAQDIYPISFLGQEGAECDLIWKHLGKEGLLVDKNEIVREISEITQKLPEKSLPLYKKGSALSKKLIEKLVINRMAFWLIGSVSEKETKEVYEKQVEDHVMDLVKWDEDGCCQVKEQELQKLLKNFNRDVQEEEGLDVGLMGQRVINVDLIKDVIVAEAMKCQSLKTRALFTHLIVKEEVPGSWIRRFLKLNLWDLQSAQKGQKMIYGIDYGIKNDVLCFSGVAEEKFCGRTIVLQITDLRHKILKEVWIHGVNEKGELGESGIRSEGKAYEML